MRYNQVRRRTIMVFSTVSPSKQQSRDPFGLYLILGEVRSTIRVANRRKGQPVGWGSRRESAVVRQCIA